jgi:PAS domain S-box-containing protein
MIGIGIGFGTACLYLKLASNKVLANRRAEQTCRGTPHFYGIQAPVIATDIQGRITYWGSGAEALYDCRAKEALGQVLNELILPERLLHDIQLIHLTPYADDVEQGRAQYLMKNRQPSCIEVTRYPSREDSDVQTGGIAVSGEVIKTTKIEEALRQSEKRFSTIFHTSPIAITFSRICDRRYFDVNDAYLALHGYSREEMLNGEVQTNTIWADAQQRAEYERLRQEQGGVRQFEFTFLKTSGETGTGLLSSERIELDGELYSIAFTLDITERKQAEQQRLELALANEKVQFLTEFLGNISHDLKTPLTVINTSFYLLERLTDPAKQQDQLKKIKQQTCMLEKYIQDILIITRLDHTGSLLTESVNLNNLIQQIDGELRPAAEKKNLKTTLNLDKDMPPVLGDEDELHSAIVNLVENAFNYTPEGGSVAIDTYVREHQAVAKVSDTGIGIKETELPHIFERFYRSDEAKASVKTGSGLGLAIVKRVIDLHHGSIEVESSPGRGTTFEVRLPVVRQG